jgi:purine-binding chemotaxis protein CheW
MRAVRTLLTPAIPDASGLATHQFLTFSCHHEHYALDITQVKEILAFTPITPIPLMPEFIQGVMNLRGAVVPVIDLSARLGKGVSPRTRRTCMIIVEIHHQKDHFDLSVIVDSVSQVIELGDENIQPPPQFGAKIHSEFIESMLKIEQAFVIVLKLEHVFSIDELSELATLSQTTAPHLNPV